MSTMIRPLVEVDLYQLGDELTLRYDVPESDLVRLGWAVEEEALEALSAAFVRAERQVDEVLDELAPEGDDGALPVTMPASQLRASMRRVLDPIYRQLYGERPVGTWLRDAESNAEL